MMKIFLGTILMILASALSGFATNGNGERVRTIVFFGDSLTSGYGIDPQETYPAYLQEKITERGWNFRAINAGVSGETSAGGLRRVNWVMRQPVDVFVLALGANDGLRGLDPRATRENLQAIIDAVKTRSPQVQIVIAGMLMPPNMGEDYTTAFASTFPALAEKNQARLIPFLLDGVGGVPDLNLPDGVHPTGEGHRLMAKTVWSVLEPLLHQMENGYAPTE